MHLPTKSESTPVVGTPMAKVDSTLPGDADGGYRYPVEYVNQVQRQQSWHLPDPVDPTPVERGITVYFTRLTVGGVNFAILEDRKFKSGPAGKIPQLGPDHINDPTYDPKSIDLPGLQLLGERQEQFLHEWSQDWTGAEMKAVLLQTAFAGLSIAASQSRGVFLRRACFSPRLDPCCGSNHHQILAPDALLRRCRSDEHDDD
jgi:hypothetical protein